MKKELPVSVVVVVILACLAVAGYLLYDRFKEPPVKSTLPANSKELDMLMEKSMKERDKMTPEDWKKLREMKAPGRAATPGG